MKTINDIINEAEKEKDRLDVLVDDFWRLMYDIADRSNNVNAREDFIKEFIQETIKKDKSEFKPSHMEEYWRNALK